MKVSCKQCAVVFEGTPQHRYCSVTCQRQHRKETGQTFRIQIMRRYGLTFEQYEKLVQLHDGKCAICGRSDPGRVNTERLFIDHCHSTQRIRGILCYKCNTMLGNASDDPEILRKAADYLEGRCKIPTYEFECIKCHKVVEIQRSMKDDSTPLCMEQGCDGQQEMEQLISKSAFALKGMGWASDGYSKTGVD